MSTNGLKICLLILLLSAGTAHAQASGRFQASQIHAPDGSVFVAGFSISDANGTWTTEVFSRPDPAQRSDGIRYPRAFTARHALATAGGDEQVAWVEGSECAPMLGVLQGLEDWTSPRLDLPALYGVAPAGAQPPGAPAMPIEGAGYEIWGYGKQADGAPAYVDVSAGNGLLATLVAWADERMAACWTPKGRAA